MEHRKITIGTKTYITYMEVRHSGKTHFLKTETYIGITEKIWEKWPDQSYV
jgi:hypothetical protein